MYLRDASFETVNADMPHGLRKLVLPWLHMSDSSSVMAHDRVCVLHPTETTDPFLNTVFHGDITYYSTAFIGQVRFTTTHYARDKVSDDSSIIFKTSSEESFGRIRRIFTVDKGDPMFYVGVISNMTNFELTTHTGVYSYAGIQTGSFDEETNSLFVTASDIVEKCVFYERKNKMCTFFRFSNLQESS